MSIKNGYRTRTVKEQMPSLLDYSLQGLTIWLEGQGIAPYRAKQILTWIYAHQINGFQAMTNISKSLRQALASHFTIPCLNLVQELQSQDGTRKFLFRLADGSHIETVHIPEENRSTLCISSQVGCALGCCFCQTAKGGLVRNLTQGEILDQVRYVNQHMGNQAPITNIVLMGMGEPLANFDRVIGALSILTDPQWGMAISPRRVTLSTAGIAPRLAQLARCATVNLAVSINAPDNKTRSKLMPINETYPLETLIQACRSYPLPPSRRITFEYILIKGINDSPTNAQELTKRLHGLRAKINLIPFNPHPGSDFQRPSRKDIITFQNVLLERRYTVMIRNSRGDDIAAACGQLRAREEGYD